MDTTMSADAPDQLSVEQKTTGQKSIVKKLLPLGIIAAALALIFGMGWNEYFALDTLSKYESQLDGFVNDNYVVAILGFVALYAVLVAVFFPGALILTIFGGFLFGAVAGSAAVITGASLGAVINYILARWVMRDLMVQKAGNALKKVETGLQENELSYMFILRLVPAFPFFVVNIVAGVFGVKMRNYLISMAGIIPGSAVYASIGNGFRQTLAEGGELSIGSTITQPYVLFPMVGLVILALIPVVVKKFSKNRVAE